MGFLKRQDPQKVRHRCAWRYFMSHYRERSNGNTGIDYAIQAIVAIVLVGILFGNLVIALFDFSVGGITLAIVLILSGLTWLMRTMDHAVDLAMKASQFAEKATQEIDNPEDVKEYFDQLYPWQFH